MCRNLVFQNLTFEKKSLKFRRSIYVAEDIPEGAEFTTKNLRILRPGDGSPPYMLEHFLGRKARRSYRRGTPFIID